MKSSVVDRRPSTVNRQLICGARNKPLVVASVHFNNTATCVETEVDPFFVPAPPAASGYPFIEDRANIEGSQIDRFVSPPLH